MKTLSFIQKFPYVLGVPVLPARRVIAIDPGVQHLRVVLAQKFLNKIIILEKNVIELPQTRDGVPSQIAQELIRSEIERLGHYPVAISLPQHISLSQVIDLPITMGRDVEHLIQNEAHRLAGLSQTKLVWDHSPLRPFGKHNNAFWISLCQEQEVYQAIERLGIEKEEVCECVSAGNALIAAYLAQFPETVSTVLVELGIRSTTVAILYEGQGVFVTSIPIGIELFAEAVATSLGCPTDKAFKIVREKNLLEGAEKSQVLCSNIENWLQELINVVQDWIIDNQDLRLNLQSFQFVLCGGGAGVPGLVDYLNKQAVGLNFIKWQEETESAEYPPGFFAIATGTAIQALGGSQQSASLLPEELKDYWRSQSISHLLQSISLTLMIILFILLGFGTWKSLLIAREKTILQANIEKGIQLSEQADKIEQSILQRYERIRPILNKKQITLDTLHTLQLISQVRSNRSLWFVLFADEQTYFSAPAISTNEPPQTNVIVFIGPQLPPAEPPQTNKVVSKPGFVAEVCIPEEGDALRRTLSQLVNALKQDHRYRNVDTVPAEQRRALAEPRTIVPDKHFALFLELATNEFQIPMITDTNVMSGAEAKTAPSVDVNPPGTQPVKKPIYSQ